MAACAASGNQQLQVPWLRHFRERRRHTNINIIVVRIGIGIGIGIIDVVGNIGARPPAG
jgi:hypothetical protein